MKIKKLTFFIIVFILIIFKSLSDEVQFEALNMDITDDGNLIVASDTITVIPLKKLKITSKKATYNKKLNKLNFIDDVIIKDSINDIIIESNNIIYEKENNLIYSLGNSKFFLKDGYKIFAENIYLDRNQNKIFGKEDAIIEDTEGNLYKLKDKYEFDIIDKIIKSRNSIIIDSNNNKYIFENLIINLQNNEIAGKEVKVEFEKSYFGNPNNDPILKGRSAHSNDEELNIYKAVFSTCNIDDRECRGWELNTEEFRHDKKNKIFEYKDSWLKIFDFKLLYLPYFNHPDPTVKRKSGFLAPSYSTSESLGNAINFPYFKVLGNDKDITFNPRYYADKSFLLQNEYRQILKDSKITSDFSFLIGDSGTKGHLFFNQIGKLKENVNFEFNLQNVEGDNYLKNYRLSETSNIITDDNLLLSNLDLDWKFSDSELNTSFKVFEDLSRSYSDRYQYVFPDFNFYKSIKIPDNYNGDFNFNSYGFNKNYDTNINESVITNDFIFSSIDFINSMGISSNYNALLKNSNSYANNSSNFEENSSYDLFGTVKVDMSLPLQKKLENFTHYLKPVMSFRYSPNGNSDLASKDVLLNYDNVFSLNRIGSQHQVEGGESVSLGLEFKRSDIYGKDILDFNIANVLKSKENIYLPSKSKLNKTRSDIFGNLNYYLTEELKVGYSFSYDRDLEYTNLEQFNLEYGVNNFFTNFTYYREDNDIGDKETFKNKSSLNISNENKLSFEVTKDLRDDFTQYYDIIYSYETDCISIDLKYNKSFFRDGNLEPNKSLSFLLKIIPFTEIGVPNVGSLVGK